MPSIRDILPECSDLDELEKKYSVYTPLGVVLFFEKLRRAPDYIMQFLSTIGQISLHYGHPLTGEASGIVDTGYLHFLPENNTFVVVKKTRGKSKQLAIITNMIVKIDIGDECAYRHPTFHKQGETQHAHKAVDTMTSQLKARRIVLSDAAKEQCSGENS